MCKFCECKSPLDSVAETWILEDECETTRGHIEAGLCILPNAKELDFVIHGNNFEELYIKHIKIKFCPICGKEL